MGCRLKPIFISFKSTGFTSSTFPIQPDFSQNQPAAITLNTGSPRALILMNTWWSLVEIVYAWTPDIDFNEHLVKPCRNCVCLFTCHIYIDPLRLRRNTNTNTIYEHRIHSCVVREECEAAGPAMASADEKAIAGWTRSRGEACVLGRCGQQESSMKKFLSRVVWWRELSGKDLVED